MITVARIIAFLKATREESGETAEEFAERLGVERNTVRNWESGETEISAYHLFRWIEAQGCRLEFYA